MHNSIIYFSSEEDINLEKVKESIKFENEYPDPKNLNHNIDYVDYLYHSLTIENIQNIFVESIPHSPFKIDELFDGNDELIKIDILKKDLIIFLKCLQELKIEIEQEKLNLLENGELDLITHFNESLVDNHNQLTHMENNETAGLFINVDEEIMNDCLTMDQLIQSLKWELDEKDVTSFYVISSFAGDYHI
ncbi:hypothetical protein [Staphylococcus epidermidis]|uniref:hypothetical protein n=1 Tax=Staphylococcus epidermidis TaxID=1282 RepID=UPI00066B2B12|nr:hypothetical protein [Staphylococcus epidermidis]MBF2205085.1 hypothetical protein [Staphylococcus epidermidis]MBF2209510.1 hypothetical protein [Staphylococcus epidermidis]MBF2211734.1 hypothetical protein [Staphylococcus epidermidis]MBM0783741.1 hypothetical protein [Staphylococcus epidermidis]MBM0813746.1 hypothetical protein [Staphylococcus epidermidis]